MRKAINHKEKLKGARKHFFNINRPITPKVKAGTSFQSNVLGSGNTKIKNVNLFPEAYEFRGTPISEAGITGKKFKMSNNNDDISFESFQ